MLPRAGLAPPAAVTPRRARELQVARGCGGGGSRAWQGGLKGAGAGREGGAGISPQPPSCGRIRPAGGSEAEPAPTSRAAPAADGRGKRSAAHPILSYPILPARSTPRAPGRHGAPRCSRGLLLAPALGKALQQPSGFPFLSSGWGS